MKYFLLCIGGLAVLSCRSTNVQPTPEQLQKIRFDLSQLDEAGLIGPKDGKVALDYEFCIPRQEQYRKEVEGIDPSLKVQTARGRIGCGSDQYLCLGNTHQENFREILYRLAKLDYVEKIERAFFE
ncbi:MAG: hypothetical protein KDD19_16340 [Phaeodactylibacter sp.]|nr:hypothetical protein [Phaeodactylibacter sp.]